MQKCLKNVENQTFLRFLLYLVFFESFFAQIVDLSQKNFKISHKLLYLPKKNFSMIKECWFSSNQTDFLENKYSNFMTAILDDFFRNSLEENAKIDYFISCQKNNNRFFLIILSGESVQQVFYFLQIPFLSQQDFISQAFDKSTNFQDICSKINDAGKKLFDDQLLNCPTIYQNRHLQNLIDKNNHHKSNKPNNNKIPAHDEQQNVEISEADAKKLLTFQNNQDGNRLPKNFHPITNKPMTTFSMFNIKTEDFRNDSQLESENLDSASNNQTNINRNGKVEDKTKIEVNFIKDGPSEKTSFQIFQNKFGDGTIKNWQTINPQNQNEKTILENILEQSPNSKTNIFNSSSEKSNDNYPNLSSTKIEEHLIEKANLESDLDSKRNQQENFKSTKAENDANNSYFSRNTFQTNSIQNNFFNEEFPNFVQN